MNKMLEVSELPDANTIRGCESCALQNPYLPLVKVEDRPFPLDPKQIRWDLERVFCEHCVKRSLCPGKQEDSAVDVFGFFNEWAGDDENPWLNITEPEEDDNCNKDPEDVHKKLGLNWLNFQKDWSNLHKKWSKSESNQFNFSPETAKNHQEISCYLEKGISTIAEKSRDQVENVLFHSLSQQIPLHLKKEKEPLVFFDTNKEHRSYFGNKGDVLFEAPFNSLAGMADIDEVITSMEPEKALHFFNVIYNRLQPGRAAIFSCPKEGLSEDLEKALSHFAYLQESAGVKVCYLMQNSAKNVNADSSKKDTPSSIVILKTASLDTEKIKELEKTFEGHLLDAFTREDLTFKRDEKFCEPKDIHVAKYIPRVVRKIQNTRIEYNEQDSALKQELEKEGIWEEFYNDLAYLVDLSPDGKPQIIKEYLDYNEERYKRLLPIHREKLSWFYDEEGKIRKDKEGSPIIDIKKANKLTEIFIIQKIFDQYCDQKGNLKEGVALGEVKKIWTMIEVKMKQYNFKMDNLRHTDESKLAALFSSPQFARYRFSKKLLDHPAFEDEINKNITIKKPTVDRNAALKDVSLEKPRERLLELSEKFKKIYGYNFFTFNMLCDFGFVERLVPAGVAAREAVGEEIYQNYVDVVPLRVDDMYSPEKRKEHFEKIKKPLTKAGMLMSTGTFNDPGHAVWDFLNKEVCPQHYQAIQDGNKEIYSFFICYSYQAAMMALAKLLGLDCTISIAQREFGPFEFEFDKSYLQNEAFKFLNLTDKDPTRIFDHTHSYHIKFNNENNGQVIPFMYNKATNQPAGFIFEDQSIGVQPHAEINFLEKYNGQNRPSDQAKLIQDVLYQYKDGANNSFLMPFDDEANAIGKFHNSSITNPGKHFYLGVFLNFMEKWNEAYESKKST